MAQRYAAMRGPLKSDDRIHYWIANPGSLLWLTADRPAPDASCTDYDKFKYGLDGGFPSYQSHASKLGREGLVERYRSRNMHYAWGTVRLKYSLNACMKSGLTLTSHSSSRLITAMVILDARLS
jgi:hypothetical protein